MSFALRKGGYMMEVKVIKSGLLQTNTYIVSKEHNCIIIDPAFACNDINEYIANNNLKVLGILLTLGHFDHIDSCNTLAKQYSCKVYIGENDLNIVSDPNLNGSRRFLKRDIIIDKQYLSLFDHEIILKLDNFMIDVMFTPGHSRGSCCYLIGDELFSGDTLFKDGIGRVDLPEGNSQDMNRSLRHIFNLKNEIVVFPGHGSETSILKERNRYI